MGIEDMSKKDDIETVGSVLGIAVSLLTIYQAVKKCPCDGTHLTFKIHCDQCNHNHYL